MFENIPETVFSQIITFLNFKDFLAFAVQNHAILKLSSFYQWILIRDALMRYFPLEIDLFCVFGYDYELKDFLGKQASEVILKTSSIQWKEFLRKESILRRRWIEVLDPYLDCRDFVNSVFCLLKDPSLPLIKIRRENVGSHAKTCFQNKLCDVLYEGSSIPNAFFMENEEFLGFLKTERDNFLDESVTINQEQVKLYRWYRKETFQEKEGIILEEKIQEKSDFIINIYEILYDTIIFQVELVAYVLDLQKNPLDLLFHYNTKWNTFVASMAEYENIFSSFIDLFNCFYEKQCKKYPSFPKFSIWRLMQKLWISKVFLKFEQKLFFSFLFIIDYIRCMNLTKMLSKFELNSENNKNLFYFIDCLYQDHTLAFLAKYNINFMKNNELLNNDEFNYTNFNHEFFKNENLDLHLNVASTFFQTVVDLSVNEINVHYLGHSKFESDSALNNLHDLFLEDSKEIYFRIQKAFGTLILQFKEFLLNDYQELMPNLIERTSIELNLIQKKAWVSAYQDYFLQIFSSFIENKNTKISQENDNKLSISIEKIDIFIKEFLDTFEEKLSHDQKSDRILLSDQIKNILITFPPESISQILEKLRETLLNEKDCEKTLILFLKTILEINNLETEKPELDQEIEELNKYRRLPFPLEETEKYFYFPFRDITVPFLEDIYQKYLSNLDTHEHDDMSEEDLDEYNQSENNDSLETYNEEEEELKLSKKTSEMIGEDIPILRKNRSNMSQKKKLNNNNNYNFIHEANPPKSVRSFRSTTSKKSKVSKESNQKMNDELDDLDLPPLKLK